jgi:hypothetical protein
MSLVISIWFATGTFETGARADPTGPVRRCGTVARMLERSSIGGVPLVIWAPAVDPAEVPMIRSASVTSNPAAKRPAMTPISQALPADPPPWRTNARAPAAGAVKVKRRDEEGAVCKGNRLSRITCRALPAATISVAPSWTARKCPLSLLRSWGSPPVDGLRSR